MKCLRTRMKSKPWAPIARFFLGVTFLALPLTSLGFVPTVPATTKLPRVQLQQSLKSTDQVPSAGRSTGRWRRAFRKVLGRGESPRKDSVFSVSQKTERRAAHTAMKMAYLEMLEADVVNSHNITSIIRDFEELTPSDVFPGLSIDGAGMPYLRDLSDLGIVQETEEEDIILYIQDMPIDSEVQQRAAILNRMVKSWFENLLVGLVHRWSIEPPENLSINVRPRGNVASNLLRGKVKSEAEISFTKAVFARIQVSGGRIQAKRLALNLRSFLPDMLRQGTRRYPSQFDFYFTDFVFTEEDLIQSRCIRNGLQRLLTRILKRVDVLSNDVVVKSLRLLPGGKISCVGEAGTSFGAKIPFEVRSRIQLSSRGHVLTFPGLEVSVHPAIGIFMPVVPEITLDMGHNAQLLSVFVDGYKKKLTISAKATVTPDHTLKLREYLQAKESYSSHFTFDVGRWLTRIGNFTA